ncbi:MAG: uroporphyrinogen decarboxylase family protein [Bryobacteraceae bacterium]
MTGRERIALTMRHCEPDRVPVMCQLSIGHYNLNAGYKPHEIWYETEAFADASVRMARRYGFDGILVVLPGRPANYLDRVVSIRAEEDGEWLIWRNGDRTFLPWDDMPHHYPADAGKPTRADFAAFDPERGFDRVDDYLGYTWNALYHVQETAKPDPGLLRRGAVPDFLLRAFDLVHARAGADLSIHGSIYSPLTHFFELFGYEAALTAFLSDPGKVHAILERLAENTIAWGLALLERGAEALDQSSAFVGAPFLSRKMYREFVVPYERRVNQALQRAGAIVYTHTCGRIADRIGLLAESGTNGIDTLDPPPLGNCDLAAVKREYGGCLFLKGNMNSVALLQYGTREQVIEEASRALRIGKPGAGYILSTACSVAPRVEPWKLELLAPLADDIGGY